MAIQQYVDITPTPRVLRILGDIPFHPWQCIAELADNSIDAFFKADADGVSFPEGKLINITWSGNNVAYAAKTLEITDNAPGMTLEQMQDAVRAGYTSNDPFNSLGLFGMGFNIATARLGSVTEIMTAKSDDDMWVGLRIDFDELMKSGKYDVPVLFTPKLRKDEHGTRITVSNLKAGIIDTLSNKEKDIRSTLQRIYSPILSEKDIKIRVKGKELSPVIPCVWDAKRYVVHNNEKVYAIQPIDYSLGVSYFDTLRNSYLSEYETDHILEEINKGNSLPNNIVQREKRIKGWIGIQRYSDPSRFGLDFIRNGRKIILEDKSFFYYDNPLTGEKELQYPTELGSTVGGRIVGELHVDFLIPTYQKNDFDRGDRSWQLMADYLRGSGPYRPQLRKSLGFTEPNESKISILVNAYGRVDAGTKHLSVPRVQAKEFLKLFNAGDEQYLSDERWFKAAQEADQSSANKKEDTTVNQGAKPSDDIDSYFDVTNTTSTSTSTTTETAETPKKPETKVTPEAPTSTLEDLKKNAMEIVSLSGMYNFGPVAPYDVTVYKLLKGEIKKEGVSKPTLFVNDGIKCTYVYNPRHPFFRQYAFTEKGILLQYIAEMIKAREPGKYTDVVDTYINLVMAKMPESKIDKIALQEQADIFFTRLRESMANSFEDCPELVIECIHESVGDVEETATAMLSQQELIDAFQKKEPNLAVLEYVPARTLIRIIEKYPENVFDGKVFNTYYKSIQLEDEKSTERLRNEAKDRMVSYLKDVVRLNSSVSSMEKNDLYRIQISLQYLMGALV